MNRRRRKQGTDETSKLAYDNAYDELKHIRKPTFSHDNLPVSPYSLTVIPALSLFASPP